ncbi:MAG: FAD-binding protein, partial [Dehalococcoidia bacterium]|nr:FAD-binding protein [Dehalococcoidia bacterium]
MPNSDRRTFLKTILQGTLAAGIGLNLPEGAWVYADETTGAQNNNQTKENRVEADVLVIGGGIAGCFAAIKAAEQGAKVILVDKGYVGKSGQSPYAGSFMIFNTDWGHDIDVCMNEYNRISEYLNNRYWTEITLKESYARYQDLVSWGCQFKKDKDGKLSAITGKAGQQQAIQFHVTNGEACLVLRKKVLKSGAKILDRVMITELLKQNGRIVGAVGMSVDSDDLYTITAKGTILCVGACGFKPPGYPPLVQLTCDGEAMAYRAGAEILGKEFVDTHFTKRGFPDPVGQKRPLINSGTESDDLKKVAGDRGPSAMAGVVVVGDKTNAEGNVISDRPDGTSGYLFAYLQLELEAHAGRAPITANANEVVGGACLGMSLRKADGIWPANNNCGSSLPG